MVWRCLRSVPLRQTFVYLVLARDAATVSSQAKSALALCMTLRHGQKTRHRLGGHANSGRPIHECTLAEKRADLKVLRGEGEPLRRCKGE